MSHKIIGVTVGTPTSPAKMRRELKPVQTINGVEPDETGNVQVETGSGTGAKPTQIDFSNFESGWFTETINGEVITHIVTIENGRPIAIDGCVIVWGDS